MVGVVAIGALALVWAVAGRAGSSHKARVAEPVMDETSPETWTTPVRARSFYTPSAPSPFVGPPTGFPSGARWERTGPESPNEDVVTFQGVPRPMAQPAVSAPLPGRPNVWSRPSPADEFRSRMAQRSAEMEQRLRRNGGSISHDAAGRPENDPAIRHE